jgi:hypothetical protein
MPARTTHRLIYIASNVSFQERRPRTLRSGYSFALFHRHADNVGGEGNSDGIYCTTRGCCRGTNCGERGPVLLLSSNVQEDNAVLTVDLANLELMSRDGVALRGELIHVNPLKNIWQNTCYKLLLVHTFDTRRHFVTLGLKFYADFADLFEVRGQKRSQRGRFSAERLSDAAVALRYLGLDGSERIIPGVARCDSGRPPSSCRATYSSIRIFACVARITATACFAAYSADWSGYARRHSATPAR